MCGVFIDDLSVAVRSTQNLKMIEEQIPTSYIECWKKIIDVTVKPHREDGRTFPMVKYELLE